MPRIVFDKVADLSCRVERKLKRHGIKHKVKYKTWLRELHISVPLGTSSETIQHLVNKAEREYERFRIED